MVDDVIALYSCQPTVERVARYAPGESPFPISPIAVVPGSGPDMGLRSTSGKKSSLISAMVYDDQFVYANDRYKMAGQWFGLPKLFPKSENLGYEIVRNDDTLIQFKNKQVSSMP